MLESKLNQAHAENFLNWLLRNDQKFLLSHAQLPNAIDDYNSEYKKKIRTKGGDWGGIAFYISANHVPGFTIETRVDHYHITRTAHHNPDWIVDT